MSHHDRRPHDGHEDCCGGARGDCRSGHEHGGCGCGDHTHGHEESKHGHDKEAPSMPAVTFSTFVLSLASSALVQLGEVPDPATGKNQENIHLARHTIDLLSMLQEKTSNGLDAEESRLLDGLLYELRMKFVVKK